MDDDDVKQQIENAITENRVMLYMKGTPSMPMCGFSAQVVHILNQLGVDYAYFDVLQDDSVRQAIKEFSDWPTIPQLYIDGAFVGGCDRITEMASSGELQMLLAG